MKGFVFSSDSSLGLFLIFVSASFFMFFVFQNTLFYSQQLKQFSDFRKTSSFLNIFIRDRNENFPLLGSAYYDTDKKRIIENTIDYNLLKKMELPFYLLNSKIYLQCLFLKYEDNKSEVFCSLDEEENCFSMERFVVVMKDKRYKAKLIARFCYD
ncbi:MAG: hypothetical protein N3D73_01540 [Candidatus Diapherotrites archaeon]|nr:hypothetical protein [Candidatus Diapherotrites archaeon]